MRVRLIELILFAYNVRDERVEGTPAWARTDRFDIAARAPGEQPLDQVRLMLQRLLEDRFRLRVRQERRERLVYAMVLARTDGKPGNNLRQADADCLTNGVPVTDAASRKPGALVRQGETSRGTCVPIELLASSLTRLVGNGVSNRTGLTGLWDFELTFADQGQAPTAVGLAVDPGSASSVVAALQEQLGLKLESSRGLVDVLVIDSVRQPTEN
jgi:uncharacterized protein (TIGR03435 family)